MPALKKTLISTLMITVTVLGAGVALPGVAGAVSSQQPPPNTLDRTGSYAIHLKSMVPVKPAEALRRKLSDQGINAYIAQTEINGVLWQRIRVGFYGSKAAANTAAQRLRAQFPTLWITEVAATEKAAIIEGNTQVASIYPVSTSTTHAPTTHAATTHSTTTHTPKTPAPASQLLAKAKTVLYPIGSAGLALATVSIAPLQLAAADSPLEEADNETQPAPEANNIEEEMQAVEQQTEPVSSEPLSPAQDANLKKQMETAKQSMIAQEYNRAIQLYLKVLREPENIYTKQALEFTGVARERKGQKAQAKIVYEQYLERYPEGDDAVRIQQRLTALITAAETPRTSTAQVADKDEPSRWDLYGGISQFYRRDESTTETEDFETTSVNRSALTTDLYLTGRYRGDEYDLRTRFSGGYEEDFLDSDESEMRISTLYVDLQDQQATNSLRFGRQSSSTGGILGRFDGAILGHSFNESVKLNLVTGFPVESSTFDEINTDRVFYGLNMDLGTYANAWDFNVFIIEQQNDGVLDRRAIGGEARYFQPDQTLFTLLDYDISYDELNTAFLLGSWTNQREQTFNVSLDYRNSPTLTTTTAIQSQSVNTLSQLLATGITEDEARQFAQDRTIRSSTATIGMVQPVTENFQLSGDLTVSKLGDSAASGGVEAFEGTDTEYSLFVQAIGNDLLKSGDLAVVGLRYTDATTSNRYALSLNTRYPISDTFRINPRLQTEYRRNTDDDTDQWFVRPSMRMEYRWRKQTRFELDVGGEYSNRELTDDTSQTDSYFISVGYRHDF